MLSPTRDVSNVAERARTACREVSGTSPGSSRFARKTSGSRKADKEEVQKEKVKLLMKIDELLEQEEKLQARIESLQAENDFTTEQLNNMKAKMEAMKKMLTETPKIPEFDSRGTRVDLVNLLDLQLLSNDEKSDDDAGPDFEGNHKDEDEEFDHPDL